MADSWHLGVCDQAPYNRFPSPDRHKSCRIQSFNPSHIKMALSVSLTRNSGFSNKKKIQNWRLNECRGGWTNDHPIRPTDGPNTTVTALSVRRAVWHVPQTEIDSVQTPRGTTSQLNSKPAAGSKLDRPQKSPCPSVFETKSKEMRGHKWTTLIIICTYWAVLAPGLIWILSLDLIIF